MQYRPYRFIGLLLLLLLFSCNKRTTSPEPPPPGDLIQVTPFGEDNTLEIATWNLETFPKDDGDTIFDVKEIIRDLDIDIYAVQEISDDAAFWRLVDSLNAIAPEDRYEGRLNDLASFLKTGIIYKRAVVQVLADTHLFVGDYDFAGRPPYALRLKAQKNLRAFDFTLIVIHLKAFDSSEDRRRRRNAIQKLNAYIDNQVLSGADPDFVVAGDWNDRLEDPPGSNVFGPFLDDTLHYRFLTLPLAGDPDEYSFIGGSFRSLIDHILITASIDTLYPGHVTRVLKLDQEFNAYESEVSDHRPVASKFPVFP